MTTTPEPRQTFALTRRQLWLRRLPLAMILLVAIIGTLVLKDHVGFETLARHQERLTAFRDAHYMLTVLGFLSVYVAIVAFSLPGATMVTLAGGFLFNLFPGALYNVIGAGTGAMIVFLVARLGFGSALSERLERSGGAVLRVKDELARSEWSVLFLMRLIPAVPFFLANLIPAAFGTSLWRFAVSTYLGIIPAALIYTSVGAGLGKVFARGETPDLGILLSPGVLFPLLGLIALAILPIIVRSVRKRP